MRMEKNRLKARTEAAEIPVWCLRVCLRLCQFRKSNLVLLSQFLYDTEYRVKSTYLRCIMAISHYYCSASSRSYSIHPATAELHSSPQVLNPYSTSTVKYSIHMEVKVHGWPAADQQPSIVHGNLHGNPRAIRIGPDRPKMFVRCSRRYSSAGTITLLSIYRYYVPCTGYSVLIHVLCTILTYTCSVQVNCTGQVFNC